MNHFTDQAGFNGIGSLPIWTFKALQPRATHNPIGAYFTNYAPTEPNLAKKIFVPRIKLAFMFSFRPPTSLLPLPGGRGRLKRIYYSPIDYPVHQDYQVESGPTGL